MTIRKLQKTAIISGQSLKTVQTGKKITTSRCSVAEIHCGHSTRMATGFQRMEQTGQNLNYPMPFTILPFLIIYSLKMPFMDWGILKEI